MIWISLIFQCSAFISPICLPLTNNVLICTYNLLLFTILCIHVSENFLKNRPQKISCTMVITKTFFEKMSNKPILSSFISTSAFLCYKDVPTFEWLPIISEQTFKTWYLRWSWNVNFSKSSLKTWNYGQFLTLKKWKICLPIYRFF